MSREKGSRGEREVAHLIKVWWNKLEPTAQFIRTPLSGGWQTNTGAAAHFNACGDLMTTAKLFPFCVEVKWRQAWSVNNFLDSKPTTPWAWWIQTLAAAAKQQTVNVPMMWMRKNRIPGKTVSFPWVVLIPKSYADAKVLSAPDIEWDPRLLAVNGVDYGGTLPVGYVFDRFLQMAPQRMRLEQ